MSILPKLAGALLMVSVASVACGGKSGKAGSQTKLTPKEIVAKSKPAIVRVEVSGGENDQRVGTGFVIQADGLIATNLHVIALAEKITVVTADGSKYPVDHIAGADPAHDLVLLDIDPPKPMPVLPLGDSAKAEAGDPVLAIGNPLSLDYTVSDGLISSVRTFKGDDGSGNELTVLQISAPISVGSSGGPLFNPYGEVIGITTAIFAPTQSQNLNFAMPSNYLKPLLAAPERIPLPVFAAATRKAVEDAKKQLGGGPAPGGPKIERKAPPLFIDYDKNTKLLDGCDRKELDATEEAISKAIAMGAPLYNDGKIDECFAIYEGASSKAERELKCRPVRDTFGHGLKRAAALGSAKEKAWALRDTFDGILWVIRAKREGVRPSQIPNPFGQQSTVP